MTAFMTYKEECESLHQQLAEKDAEIERLIEYTKQLEEFFDGGIASKLNKQLAACQAREQRLRDALEYFFPDWENYSPLSWKYEVKEALSTPQDTTALSEMITEAGALLLERCADLCDRFAARGMHPAECAAAIRAMPGSPGRFEGLK